MLSKYLPRHEEVSLPELEKVGRAWVTAHGNDAWTLYGW